MKKLELSKLPRSINYLMDRMKLMKQLPDKCIDIAIIDPEYGINSPNMRMGSNVDKKNGKMYISTAEKVRTKGRMNDGRGKLRNRILNKSEIGWDNDIPPKQFFDEIFRVSKHQIIWGGNYFTAMLPPSRCWICWDKRQPWDNFSQFELAWTSFDMPSKMYQLGSRGGANAEPKIHPNQKPVKLYTRILNDFAKPGMTILDTGTGSGSLRIAVEDWPHELQFIGCDNNIQYHTDEHQRFNRHLARKATLSVGIFDKKHQYIQTEIFK